MWFRFFLSANNLRHYRRYFSPEPNIFSFENSQGKELEYLCRCWHRSVFQKISLSVNNQLHKKYLINKHLLSRDSFSFSHRSHNTSESSADNGNPTLLLFLHAITHFPYVASSKPIFSRWKSFPLRSVFIGGSSSSEVLGKAAVKLCFVSWLFSHSANLR